MPTAVPARVEFRHQADDLVAVLSGNWALNDAVPRFAPLMDAATAAVTTATPIHTLSVDAAALGAWDSSLLIFLRHGQDYCADHKITFDPAGIPPLAARLLALARLVPERAVEASEPRPSAVARLGLAALAAYDAIQSLIAFMGEVILRAARMLRGRGRMRWREFWVVVQSNSSGALPIVTLIALLVGVIIAFLGVVVLRRFVDRTGRPGPATWEAGSYPAGQGDLPVSGVSWYEAMAYAKFSGKSLPTIYHWARVAGIYNARFIVPFSNMESKGPLPVSTPRGVSIGGVSDLAGNVREWVLNDAGNGRRFILGGGWSDPTYSFPDANAQLPMDRSPINGIRLALYDPADESIKLASLPVSRAWRDYSKETPVSDAVFAGYTPQFAYDPLPLNAKVEIRDTTNEAWIAEKVSFSAAYGSERMSAWIWWPRHG